MCHLNLHILIVILPLLLSNVIHIIAVKQNLLSGFAQPISVKLFGKNKTWRAFLMLPFLNALFLWGVNAIGGFELSNSLLLGFILGLTYLIFELPNSLIKRRLGINPGSKGQRYSFLVTLMDKMDSVFGVTLVYFLMGYLPFISAVYLFLLAFFTHFLISYLLVQLRIKKTI